MTQPTIEQTRRLMKYFHFGQEDKSGLPYYLHPIRVMMRLGQNATGAERRAALLHDVLEDTHATPEMLRAHGYDDDTMAIVQGMTKPAGVTYFDYIQGIIDSGNIGLIRVKTADVFDNSSPSRIAQLPETERGIVNRYAKTKALLLPLLGRHGLIEGDLPANIIPFEYA